MILYNGIAYEPGCYADHSYGLDHLAERTADLVSEINPALADEIREAIANDSEFTSEICDEALDEMNQHTSGGYWLQDQDLMLLEDGAE